MKLRSLGYLIIGSLALVGILSKGVMAVDPGVKNLGDKVNSQASDIAPIVSPDGNYLYFTSDRDGGLGGQDVWMSERTRDGGWSAPANLGAPVNDDRNQGPDFYYLDTETGEEFLYLTLCAGPAEPGVKDAGYCDLYRSKKTGGQWGQPEPLQGINSCYSEANATFDYIDKVLYFSSTRPGGMEGEGPRKQKNEASFDIWMCPMNEDGTWGEAKPLGAPVNTAEWEGVAFYHAADQTLYFSSNGHGGAGGADIFRSKKTASGVFSEPEPLEALNTPGNDMYFSIPASGDMSFYSSNTTGGEGREDIYVAPLYIVLEPEALALRGVSTPPSRPADGVPASHFETIYFDLESYFLNPSELAKLDKLVRFLEENPSAKIRVDGHACAMGGEEYNLILSKSRADQVVKYLLKKGVSPSRMDEAFYGESQPAVEQDPVYGDPMNRRVEISIVK